MASHRIGARVAGLSLEQLCAIIEAQAGASDAALRVADMQRLSVRYITSADTYRWKVLYSAP